MKWLLLHMVLIFLLALFVVGAVNGNYNCTGHFWTAVKGLSGFILDAVRTEVLGAKIVGGIIGI